MKKMDFEVVQIWENHSYLPFTLNKESNKSTKVYCIKVDGLYFPLGGKDDSLFICDKEEDE